MENINVYRIVFAVWLFSLTGFLTGDILARIYLKYWPEKTFSVSISLQEIAEASDKILESESPDEKFSKALTSILQSLKSIQQALEQIKEEPSTTLTPVNRIAENSRLGINGPLTNNKLNDIGCRLPSKPEMEEIVTCPVEGIFPLKDECKLFRKCYGVGSRPVFLCCPKDLWLNATLGKCVAEKDASCLKISDENPKPQEQLQTLKQESTTEGGSLLNGSTSISV